MRGDVEVYHYCKKGRSCNWKCFALDSNGFCEGKMPSEHDAWARAHKEHCGGELVEVVLKPQPRQTVTEEELVELLEQEFLLVEGITRDWVHGGAEDTVYFRDVAQAILKMLREKGCV